MIEAIVCLLICIVIVVVVGGGMQLFFTSIFIVACLLACYVHLKDAIQRILGWIKSKLC